MVGSFLAPKWPILVPFCGMDHQKSNFSLISDTLSVRGCWGQPMSLFWKLFEHKWATILTMQPEIYYQNSQSFYPSELFTVDHYFMRHPVLFKFVYLNFRSPIEIILVTDSRLSAFLILSLSIIPDFQPSSVSTKVLIRNWKASWTVLMSDISTSFLIRVFY